MVLRTYTDGSSDAGNDTSPHKKRQLDLAWGRGVAGSQGENG